MSVIKIKKNHLKKSIILAVLFAFAISVFTGCGDGDSSSSPTLTPNPQPITYSVSFNSNGGSSVPSQSRRSGETVSEPTAPTRANYDFDGWYTDNSTFANRASFPITVNNNNIALYAKWVEHIYTQKPTGNSWYVQSEHNMIDERIELMSLVCRLAGYHGWGTLDTDYQRLLETTFDVYKNHSAVTYCKRPRELIQKRP